MQAYLHLCFTSRSYLQRAWWKMTAVLVLMTFVINMIVLSPQAIAAWGGRDHQVTVSNGVVVLHHVTTSELTNDATPSLRSSMPLHADHLFTAANPTCMAESTAHSDHADEKYLPFPSRQSRHPTTIWFTQVAPITRATQSSRITALHAQWSTVCLLI
jgi:hypothetical protein